ncbi:CAP domain-containing protein [Nonomuraea sp. NPDC050310]|uniref:CAP domain-containing protein n=1 Tax=unclassified Nonomuraea TaxID=2593643 RepID=UPI0033C72BCA
MWQPPHTRLTRTRARRRSFLGPLLCLLTVLFVGVLIGRLTTRAGEDAPQIYLNNTAPPAAAGKATTSPSPRPPAQAVEKIAREQPLGTASAAARPTSPVPTQDPNQFPGAYETDHPAGMYGAADLELSAPLAAQVVRLTNNARERRGCAPLRIDRRLTRSAQEHSLEMGRSGQFSHASPDGTSPWDRMGRAGYDAGAAENIGQGYTSAEEAMRGWMASADHRKHILNCEIAAIGVGVALGAGGPWWTQDFGYK